MVDLDVSGAVTVAVAVIVPLFDVVVGEAAGVDVVNALSRGGGRVNFRGAEVEAVVVCRGIDLVAREDTDFLVDWLDFVDWGGFVRASLDVLGMVDLWFLACLGAVDFFSDTFVVAASLGAVGFFSDTLDTFAVAFADFLWVVSAEPDCFSLTSFRFETTTVLFFTVETWKSFRSRKTRSLDRSSLICL